MVTPRVLLALACAFLLAGPAAAQDLFARVELSRSDAVVGQQVVAEVVLYFGRDVQPRQTVLAQPWDAPGFWREELDVGTAYPRPAGGGRDAVTLRRVALFPTRAGRLELPPMTFRVEVVRTETGGFDPNDPFGPFFAPFRARVAEETVEAPGVALAVRPLPPGAPADFSGAVGQFSLGGGPQRTRTAAGEPVRVPLTISGEGNVATFGAPAFPDLPGVDVSGPSSAQTVERGGRRVRGTRTFTYTLVPQGGGRVDVPEATWTYFDPESRAYRTLRAPAFALDVDGAPASGRPSAAPETDALAPLATDARWRRAPVPVGVWWGVLGAGLSLPALALAGLAGRAGRGRTPPDGEARTFETAEAAARALDAALARPAADAALAARARALRDRLEAAQFAPGAPPPPPEWLAEAAALVRQMSGPHRDVRASVAALALLLAAAPAAAQPADDAFRLGLDLASQGDTLGALAAFEAAEPARAAAAAYNAGTLALAAGDAARARLHLERAARLDPFSADAQRHLALARAPLGDAAPSAAGRAWAALVAVAGAGGLVALALGLAFGALGLGLGGRSGAARALGSLAAVAVAVAVAALVGASRPGGVALADAEVRAAPSADAAPVGALRAGERVRLGASEGAWRAVRAGGIRGFVPERAVEAL